MEISMKNNLLPHNHGTHIRHLQSDMPKAEIFDMVSDLLKNLSDSKRIQIFWLLCHCEECVMNISALLEMSSPAVSHHLKLLKTFGEILHKHFIMNIIKPWKCIRIVSQWKNLNLIM